MKKSWIALFLIAGILCTNFIYNRLFIKFSDNITAITEQAAILADTDYDACGEYIDKLLEEIESHSLLLYAFSNRDNVDNIELASKSAAEYYRLNDKASLKHELLMIQHRMKELENSGKFNLENIL